MKWYSVLWYDHENTMQDKPIQGNNEQDARNKAFARYNGNPPYPLLQLEEINQ